MVALPINPSQCLIPSSSSSSKSTPLTTSSFLNLRHSCRVVNARRSCVITSVAADNEVETSSEDSQQPPPPCINFAFVSVSLFSSVQFSSNQFNTIIKTYPLAKIVKKFGFLQSVLLPDGTPDVHFRTACGGQKLRNIMLDTNIELYGPYVSTHNDKIKIIFITVLSDRVRMVKLKLL